MSSINIQTLSDKSNFINYFSEPVTVPKNAMIACPKANFRVPIFPQVRVFAPTVTGYTGSHAFRVEIDGIVEDFTWLDIYEAHRDLNITHGVETLSFGQADDYFSEYEYLPNLQAIYNQPGQPNVVKVDFNSILARAIDLRYRFYTCSPNPTYQNSIDPNTTQAQINLAGVNYDIYQVNANNLTHLGFNIEYDPFKMFAANETLININNYDRVNWIQGANIQSLRAAVGDCFMFGSSLPNNNMSFDTNGGWFTTRPNIAGVTQIGARMSFGIQLLGQGAQAGDTKKPQLIYDTTQIDYGIEFSYDGTDYLYQIIEPPEMFDDAAVSVYHSKFFPPAPVNKFNNNGDHFFIQIHRTSLYSGDNNYTLNILHGNNVDPHSDPNAVVIYTRQIKLGNGQITPMPVFMANTDAATDAWEFNTIGFIGKTDQTVQQGNMEFSGNVAGVGSFYIQPHILDQTNVTTASTAEFWESWGLMTKNIMNRTNNNMVQFTRFEGNDLMRQWKNPTMLSNASVGYFIGETAIGDMLVQKTSTNGDIYIDLNIDDQSFINNELPQLLYVNINNLAIQNFPGTAITTTTNTPNLVDSSSAETKTIQTIPLPINDIGLLSTRIDISYEPFNLLYRPLNNPNNFTVNQLNVEVYYKDFSTNAKKQINQILGGMVLEFHIKAGGRPQLNNNIKPF